MNMMKSKYIVLAILGNLIWHSTGFADASVKQENLIDEPIFNSKVYLYESGREFEISIALVHGVGDKASKVWSELIPILEKQYHVIAFDLPGFGRSEKKNALYSPQNYSSFIKWLLDRYVNGTVFLVGHSMGGAISLYFAGTYPEYLHRLLLIDAAGILHRVAFSKNIAGQKIKDTKLYRILNKPLETLNYFINTTIENIDNRFIPKDLSVLLENSLFRNKVLSSDPAKISGMAMINTNFSKQIENIKSPVFIIWGENDHIAPVRTGIMLAERIQGAQLNIMKGLGHTPMLESPEKFNKLIVECLKAEPKQSKGITTIPYNNRIATVVGKSNLIFTGNYDRIEINNCDNISLKNITSRFINVINSKVEIESSTIDSDDIALRVSDSILIVTGTTIKGNIAISTSNSKIDLAGVNLKGENAAIKSNYTSTVVFSVCKVCSPHNNRFVHEIIKIDKSNPL